MPFCRIELSGETRPGNDLKVVEALILFRRLHPVQGPADLEFIRIGLRERVTRERQVKQVSDAASGSSDNLAAFDVVGRIDSREPVVIQELRRKLRVMGRKWNTEKACVKWVKRFLRTVELSKPEKLANELDKGAAASRPSRAQARASEFGNWNKAGAKFWFKRRPTGG